MGVAAGQQMLRTPNQMATVVVPAAVVKVALLEGLARGVRATLQTLLHPKVIMAETLLQVQVAVLAVVVVVAQELLAMQEAEQLAEMVVAEHPHQLPEHL
jgi:small basic protein